MDAPENRAVLDHPHVWVLHTTGMWGCLYCAAKESPDFDPMPHVSCDHREWLPLENGLLSCMGCLILAEK